MGSTHRPEPRYANALRNVSIEDLFQMGEDVQSLDGHPGWAHVMRLIQAEIAELDAALDRGVEPLSRAQYAMAHGRRGGLLAVVRAADAIVSKYEATMAEQKARHEGSAGPGPDRSTG